jgi:alpha-1,2-mannosyltransferase
VCAVTATDLDVTGGTDPAVGSAAGRVGRASWRPAARFAPWWVLALALVPRVGFVLASQGGYQGTFAYDPSVYYAASDALLQGRLPYRDFVLLHPPGVAIAMTPFALFGRLVDDHAGFIAAQLGFTLLGAVNAALVVVVARRLGWGQRAAVLGGVFYAVWPGAAGAEYASRLEPLGNAAVLLGLLAYTAAERSPRRWWSVLCGAGFGFAVGVKVWWLAPLVVLLGWHLLSGRRARALWAAAGASGAVLLVCAPFFLAAPHRMIRMVLLDQTSRPYMGTVADRLATMTGANDLTRGWPEAALVLLAIAGGLGAAELCRRAVRRPHGRLPVAWLVSAVALLAAAPSYFPYYNDFLAPAAALVVAAAATTNGRSTGWVPSRRRAPAVVAGALALGLVVFDIVSPRPVIFSYPAAQLRPALGPARCVMSDSPMALIELNVLTRGLRNGCPNWVDVTGRSFDLDERPVYPGAPVVDRMYDARWQRALTRYLLAGDRLTVFRAYYTGFGVQLRYLLHIQVVLGRSSGFTVWQTKPLVRPRPPRPHPGRPRVR